MAAVAGHGKIDPEDRLADGRPGDQVRNAGPAGDQAGDLFRHAPCRPAAACPAAAAY